MDSGLGPTGVRDERLAFRTFQRGRVAAILSAFAAIVVIGSIAETTRGIELVYGLMLFDLFLTVPYYFLAKRSATSIPRLVLGILVVEVVIVTIGEYLWGGENAVYGLPIYGFLVVMAAALHSKRAASVVGLLGAASYGLMVLASVEGWIPMRESPFPFSLGEAWPWATVVSNSMALLALAVIAGGLSGSMRRALARSRALEHEMRALNQGLEKRVERAVEGLRSANQTLLARNNEVERVSEQIELYARAVAHDLRNPLTAASEALRLRESREGRAKEELVSMSRANLLRADRMLMGLRELMRTAGARQGLEPVAPREILKDVVEELRGASIGSENSIRIVGNLDVVFTSPLQLAHVFRNLLVNAFEHNRAQEDLLVEVGQKSGHGTERVTLFVRDNGRGIAPTLRDRVFGPFCRGPGAPDSGLGLGLALIDAIVTRAGGETWIDESPGGGATVFFTLLRSPPDAPQAARQDSL